MIRKTCVTVAMLIVGSTAATTAQNAAQTACATAAFDDYNKANTALLLQANPLMTPEATVAQRRLEEQYCLRLARCVVGGPANSSLRVPFSSAFSSCLRDEALEKYDATPK
jgi:hypothetical protein